MKHTIFNRLVIGNMIIISLAVLLVVHVIFKLEGLQRLSREIIHTDSQFLNRCEKLSNSLDYLIKLEKKYVISKDTDYYFKHKEVRDSFEQEAEHLNNVVRNAEIKTIVLQIRFLFQRYLTLFEDEYRSIKRKKTINNAPPPSGRRNVVARKIDYSIQQIVSIKNKEKTSKFLRSNAMINRSIKVTVISAVVVVFLGIVLSIINTRAINGSIFLLRNQTREISKGRFNNIPHDTTAPEEIEDLTHHFNIMCSRLKELEVMKSDFISHFSHELRTPITSIKEAASMLAMKLFSKDPKKEQDLSKLILYECDRLMQSIERILDLSRMEVFQMEWNFVRADLIKLIRNSLVKFIPAAQKKNIKLVFLPLKNLPEIRLDEKRIEEVMNNLLSNAFKYTPDRGKIIVRVQIASGKNKVIVSVEDNGCGIDKKHLEKIFEKFKRIDNRNETLRGTGLGLAITKHIINEHKGKVWAESKDSKGTKMFFILPLV